MADLVDDMLAAAADAAGAQWGTISADITGFVENLAADSAQTAAKLTQGAITPADAKVELAGLEDQGALIGLYAEEAEQLAAQNAINAAIGVLWAAMARV